MNMTTFRFTIGHKTLEVQATCLHDAFLDANEWLWDEYAKIKDTADKTKFYSWHDTSVENCLIWKQDK